MLGSGAKRVIGIDPSAKFVFQFNAIKKYAGVDLPIDVLPLELSTSETSLMVYGNSSSEGTIGKSALSASAPCPISRLPGDIIRLVSPTEKGGKL